MNLVHNILLVKKSAISILVTSLLVSSILYLGCDETTHSLGILDLEITPKEATSYVNGRVLFQLTCHNPDKLPKSPRYYWQLVAPDGSITQVSYYAGGDFFAANAGGTFTLYVDVYDSEEFDKPGSAASSYGTVTAKLIAKEVEVVIEATPDDTGRKFDFLARWTKNAELQQSNNRYSWRFGDGEVSKDNIKNTVSHEYKQDGTYTVDLGVWEQSGVNDICIKSVQKIINVGKELILSISQPELPLNAGEDLTFTVNVDSGNLPANPFYWWNFGDGTDLLGMPGTREATHLFDKEGNYDITVRLLDEDTGKELASATTQVIIGKGVINNLDLLKQTNYIKIELCTPRTNSAGSGIGCWDFGGDETIGQIEWRDDGFTLSWERTWGDGNIFTETIDCLISSDGTMITSLIAYLEYDYTDRPTEFKELKLRNVPIVSRYDIEGYPYFDSHIRNESVSDYVNTIASNDLITVEWSSDSQLFILLKKVTE